MLKQPVMPKILAGTLLAFMLLLPEWLPAAPPVAGSETPDLFSAGLKMAASLAILIGGMLLALYLVKRLIGSKGGLLGGQEMIRVIATKRLGPKNFITLVEIGDSVLTLGVTNERISRLDKKPKSEFSQSSQPADGISVKEGFASRLKALTGSGHTGLKKSEKQ